MKPEWPMEISVGIPKEDLPEDISYATQSFAVVPAEWYDKRTDLAREQNEVLRLVLPFLSDSQAVRVRDVLARYEREVGDE